MDIRKQKLIVNCTEETFTGDLVWTAEAIGNILKTVWSILRKAVQLGLPLRKLLPIGKPKYKTPAPSL
jgi:hypothetical protein